MENLRVTRILWMVSLSRNLIFGHQAFNCLKVLRFSQQITEEPCPCLIIQFVERITVFQHMAQEFPRWRFISESALNPITDGDFIYGPQCISVDWVSKNMNAALKLRPPWAHVLKGNTIGDTKKYIANTVFHYQARKVRISFNYHCYHATK